MTRFYFFSGKGGVGKTSMASATAVLHADRGDRTLIVTTDPASNLADVFEQEIGHRVTPIGAVRGLWAMEIDSQTATDEYKERVLAPYRQLFPADVVKVMEEQLNSPCTEEMAAFDKFVEFMDQPDYDVVIFDTAPTGHTLRLLDLPASWSHHITESEAGSGQTCLGPVSMLGEAKARYDHALAVLRDQESTTFAFVLQPEATAIAETQRAMRELERIGVKANLLIVNGLLPKEECKDEFFVQRWAMQQRYLDQIEREFKLPRKHMYLQKREVKGLEALRRTAALLSGGSVSEWAGDRDQPKTRVASVSVGLDRAAAQRAARGLIKPAGLRRTIFFAGKGGVGKTSVSCATALWLADHGYQTLLLTTDPASHLGEVLGRPITDVIRPVEGIPNLYGARIDQQKAADSYRRRILADAEGKYSADVIEVIKEQLASPCTEEMAAFDKFIEFAAGADHEAVVFDTAPTGHTLRLLELPIDWSRQIELKSGGTVESQAMDEEARQRFATVIDLMRDASRTTFSFVVYPEATPIMEAWRAVKELETVGVTTQLVVANLILPEEHCTTDYFRARRAMQQHYLAEMTERFSGAVIVPLMMMDHELKGLEALREAAALLYGK
ncbi:MAG: TRC40/GET3/ArsA family transport-energizing ATPase [Betaproteobacteria bacterium]